MMKKILLSGLGGSLFPYLHNQLCNKYKLFYVDSDKNLSKLYVDYNFFVAPLVTDETYGSFIKNIIDTYQIDYYVPLIDEELVKAKEEIDGYNNVNVIAPTVAFCILSLNKFKLMKVLKERGISSIASYIGSEFDWNGHTEVFVKPISGRGSRGVKKICLEDQLKAYYLLEEYRPEEILIQEYIKGVEYTVGCTVNNLNEILSISIKRIIKKRGITQIAITEDNQQLEDIVKIVVHELKPCGPINIQLYLTADNEIKIFEINPRFSTTTIMSYAGGVDEISLYIDWLNKHYNNEPVKPQNGLILHRRWENIFYE